MTNKNFSDIINKKINRIESGRNLSQREDNLKKKIVEIVSNQKLNCLAKQGDLDFPLFYSTSIKGVEDAKNSVAMNVPHTEWSFGLFKTSYSNLDYLKNNFPNIMKNHQKLLKNQLCFVGIAYDYDKEIDNNIKFISKPTIKGNGFMSNNIIKELAQMHIYSTRAFYDEDENCLSTNGLMYHEGHLINKPLPWKDHYIGKGLTPKKLEYLILEKWVEPISSYIVRCKR